MARQSHRAKLLAAGLRVVHEHGFRGASVRDIVDAAGVPQGSFTNHFASKEAFGLEVLELYFAHANALVARTLLDETRSPLARLEAYLDAQVAFVRDVGFRNGCMLGNYSADATGDFESIRTRLVEMLDEIQQAIERCLKAALQAGEIDSPLRPAELAAFVLSSLQGAILLSKAHRSTAPIKRAKRVLLGGLLER